MYVLRTARLGAGCCPVPTGNGSAKVRVGRVASLKKFSVITNGGFSSFSVCDPNSVFQKTPYAARTTVLLWTRYARPTRGLKSFRYGARTPSDTSPGYTSLPRTGSHEALLFPRTSTGGELYS